MIRSNDLFRNHSLTDRPHFRECSTNGMVVYTLALSTNHTMDDIHALRTMIWERMVHLH